MNNQIMENQLQDASIYNPAIYDLRASGRTADIDFYVEQAVRFGGPVLDLCCGTGRISIPIAKRGLNVTGLDMQKQLLAHARQKAAAANVDVEWILGDATSFQLGRRFHLILVPYYSLQLFGREHQLKSFFESVRGHLQQDGVLIFDVRNPDLNEIISGRRTGGQFTDPQTGEAVTAEWTLTYDDALQSSDMTCYFSTPRRPRFATDRLEMRWFYPQELDLLVRNAGFTIKEKLGGFDGQPFARGSADQLVIATLS